MTEKQWEHFWSKVLVTDSCWLWQGYIPADGYGRFNAWRSGGSRSPLLAHRLSYENRVGPIPDGLQLDHLGRNRRCVNPAHLEPVTPRENTLRGAAVITHCPRGHEYDEENTYVSPRGHRLCITCRKEGRARRSAELGLVHNGAKTHCLRGHEYTPANTYVKPATGHRECRTCSRMRSKRALGVLVTR